MRKSLWIILALLIVGIGTPSARADSFNATFTCSGTCVGGTPTAPDVSFPAPVVDVTWNDVLFPLTLPLSDLPTDSYVWEGRTFIVPGAPQNQGFLIHDETTQTITTLFVPTTLGVGAEDSGTLAFAAVATPEPSSYALMLLGVGLIGLLVSSRRRVPACP